MCWESEGSRCFVYSTKEAHTQDQSREEAEMMVDDDEEKDL